MTSKYPTGEYHGQGEKNGLGRRFIGIDNSEDAINVTAQRIVETTNKVFTVEAQSFSAYFPYDERHCPLQGCNAPIELSADGTIPLHWWQGRKQDGVKKNKGAGQGTYSCATSGHGFYQAVAWIEG